MTQFFDALGPADVPPEARLLLVRHGQSTWNALGKWQGQADPPLSPLGLEQAALAGEQLRRWGIAAAVGSSDLERARRTAQVLAAASGVGFLDPEPALRERHAGAWEGRVRTDIEAEFPGWIDEGRRPVGWESDRALVARAVPALQRVVAHHDVDHASRSMPRRVLVAVSHGGLIHALERVDASALGAAESLDGNEPEPPFRRVANLEGVWFAVDDHGVRAVGERVHLLPREGGETFGPEA